MSTTRMARMVSIVTLLALLSSFLALPATSAAAALSDSVTTVTCPGRTPATITRDSFGVPHITSASTYGLFCGWGYAVAQDRAFQLDLYRRSAEGRLAEVLGPGTDNYLLKQDLMERREGYTAAEYMEMFNALPRNAQDLLLAYGNGINIYLAEAAANPNVLSVIPAEFIILGYLPQSWTPVDSMAVIRFMVRRFGEVGGNELINQADFQTLLAANGGNSRVAARMYNDLHWVNDPTSPVTIPPRREAVAPSPAITVPPGVLPGVGPIADEYLREREQRIETWKRLSVPPKFGSYAWAVAPSRTANGHPLLYGGPQMGFGYPDIVHEVELDGGDRDAWHVFGMGFAGAPLVLIGQNDWLAWTSTTGMGDNKDIYAEQLNPANPGQYWHNSAWHDMEVRVEQVPVRTSPISPGSQVMTTTVPYTISRTVHGPVIGIDAANNLAYSEKRQHWLKEQNTFLAFTYFDTAHNLAEFGVGADLVETSHNFMVATNSGDIAYWQTGHVPMRADGSWVGRFPLAGDGTAEWRPDIRPLPYVQNPAQGFLANWNNKPEVDFDNGDDVNFGTQFRVLQISELLAPQTSMTRLDMNNVAKDIATVGALGIESRFVLGPMLAAALTQGGDSRFAAVATLLSDWNGHQASDPIASTTYLPASVIFDEWLRATLHNTFDDELGQDIVSRRVDVNHLIHALLGLGVPASRDYFQNAANPGAPQTANSVIAASLTQALDKLTARFGTPEMTQWTPPRGTISFTHPILGKIGPDLPLSNRSTYAMIAEPGGSNTPWTVIPSGQSAFIGIGPNLQPAPGPHTLDQRSSFAVWRYKQEARLILPLIIK